jgi:hypothetical protein
LIHCRGTGPGNRGARRANMHIASGDKRVG